MCVGGHGATATPEPATTRGVSFYPGTTHDRVMSDGEFGTDPLATRHEELETALDTVEDDEASTSGRRCSAPSRSASPGRASDRQAVPSGSGAGGRFMSFQPVLVLWWTRSRN